MICPTCAKEVTSVQVANFPNNRQVHNLSCGHAGQINPNRGAISKTGTEVKFSKAQKNTAGDVTGYEHKTVKVDMRELIPVEQEGDLVINPVVVDSRSAMAQLQAKK